MVRVDRDLLAESLEHVAVMLQRIYNCQQLLVIDLVVELGWAKLSAMVRDRVQQSILAVLGNHCAKGEVRGIRLEDSGLRLVEVLEDRRCSECSPELIECSLGTPIPNELPHQTFLLNSRVRGAAILLKSL